MTTASTSTNLTDAPFGKSRVSPLDITVLAGGPGVEREVSIQSGAAVAAALMRLGHGVKVCDCSPDDLSALDRATDFVFIALHGEFGEDGALQAELDARGIRYSGSGAAASRRAIDKVAAKRCFEQAGIATPEYRVVTATNLADLSDFPVPAIVKPISSGSSVDTTIVHTLEDLRETAGALAQAQGQALVERLIEGPELTVGVLGDEALPVCEIRTKREFYDYQAKYIDDDTEYLFDLDLPADLLRRVQRRSVVAYQSLGCGVFSRVDWMIDGDTLEPYILEINTIPGFTSHSLVPKAAARVGLDFEQLCQRIIELSMAESE